MDHESSGNGPWLKPGSRYDDFTKTMSFSVSTRVKLESESEAETWAEMCQDDWSLDGVAPPVLIELRGPVVVLFWDAERTADHGLDPERLFRGLSLQMDRPLHGLVCHDEICFEFYRAEGVDLTLLDQPEEGDLGVVADHLGESDPLGEEDVQTAESGLLDAVSLADEKGAFSGIGALEQTDSI